MLVKVCAYVGNEAGVLQTYRTKKESVEPTIITELREQLLEITQLTRKPFSYVCWTEKVKTRDEVLTLCFFLGIRSHRGYVIGRRSKRLPIRFYRSEVEIDKLPQALNLG